MLFRAAWMCIAALSLLLSACERGAPPVAPSAEEQGTQLLDSMKINEETPQILYTYMNDRREFVTVESAGDVPDPFRNDVIVVNLALPPEQRQAATQVVVADLNDKTEEGFFPLRLETRATFEGALRLKREWRLNPTRKPMPQVRSLPQAARILPPDQMEDDDRIVLYSASWCSYCRKTRQWLEQQGIAFVERDIENDEHAARTLQAKCMMAKIACNGVPVIDWRGRLIQGYDLKTLGRLLGQEAEAGKETKSRQETPPKP